MSKENADASTVVNVDSILKEYLKEHGYDGLAPPFGHGCKTVGCDMDELTECEHNCRICQPAYKGPDLSGNNEYQMFASKEVAEAFIKAAEVKEKFSGKK